MLKYLSTLVVSLCELKHLTCETVLIFQEVEKQINASVKEWKKWNGYLDEFHNHLLVLPDVIAKVEIAQNRLGQGCFNQDGNERDVILNLLYPVDQYYLQQG